MTLPKNNKNMEKIFKCIDDLDMEYFRNNISIEKGMERDLYGDTLLHVATLKKSVEFVREVIKYQKDLDAQNKQGKTALHYAAEIGNIEIATIILTKGGNINIIDKYGNAPLWVAVFNDKGFGRRLEMIQLFLDFNADKYHKNLAGLSPLDFAMNANYIKVVDLLKKE